MRRKVIFAAAAIIAAAALILPAEAATFVLPAGTYQFSETLQQAGAPDKAVYRFYCTYLDQYGDTINGDRIVPWGYSAGRYRMALWSYPCYYYDGGGWTNINQDRVFTLTQDATIDSVFENWFSINVHPYSGGYPAVQVSVIDHRITWTQPGHAGTLTGYQIRRYDDDEIIVQLGPGTTSYAPLGSDRIYVRAEYETSTSGDYEFADSNDVDYIAYYEAPTLTRDGYRLSWSVPEIYPDGASLLRYELQLDGQTVQAISQTDGLITAPGTYTVRAIYSPYGTSSAASNGIEFEATSEDYLALINNQLTIISGSMQQSGMTDPEISGKLQELLEAVGGLATEATASEISGKLTELLEAITANYGQTSEEAAEIIGQLSGISEQLREIPQQQLPTYDIPEVKFEDLTIQVASLSVLFGALAPLVQLCFAHPKVALIMTMGIIISLVLAVLRHGVD